MQVSAGGGPHPLDNPTTTLGNGQLVGDRCRATWAWSVSVRKYASSGVLPTSCLFRYFWRRVTVILETSDGNSGDF